MERIISQMRWPADVYKAIKEQAWLERKSFNAMVIELAVRTLRDNKEANNEPKEE